MFCTKNGELLSKIKVISFCVRKCSAISLRLSNVSDIFFEIVVVDTGIGVDITGITGVTTGVVVGVVVVGVVIGVDEALEPWVLDMFVDEVSVDVCCVVVSSEVVFPVVIADVTGVVVWFVLLL